MHYAVLVLVPGETAVEDPVALQEAVGEVLAAFWEEKETTPWKKYARDWELKAMREHYKVEGLEELAGHMQSWNGYEGGVDEGGLFGWSTANPLGRWDWWQLGGRYAERLVEVSGATGEEVAAEGNAVRARALPEPVREEGYRAYGGNPSGAWTGSYALAMVYRGVPMWLTSEDWAEDEDGKLSPVENTEYVARVGALLREFPEHWAVMVDAHS